MAASNRGLPAVPRGLSREMTVYLQALHNVILNMSGLGRGTNGTRSVSTSEIHGMVSQYCAIVLKQYNTGNAENNKPATEIFPHILEGVAAHGETVNLGEFPERPLVAATGLEIPIGACGEIRTAISNLRPEDGEWLFDVVAAFEMGEEDGEVFYPGKINWIAIGRKENAGE